MGNIRRISAWKDKRQTAVLLVFNSDAIRYEAWAKGARLASAPRTTVAEMLEIWLTDNGYKPDGDS